MTTLADSVSGRPATMLLVNLVTGATLQPQFNPTEFEEKLGAAWSKLAVPGLSHQVKQFANTLDVTYDFELFYRVADGGPLELKRVLDARTFLYAACHPRSQTNTLNGAGPPRILFVWPGLISLNCVITALSFKYTMFNREAQPIAYSAKITLEEIRDGLVTMEDVIAQGTQNRSVG